MTRKIVLIWIMVAFMIAVLWTAIVYARELNEYPEGFDTFTDEFGRACSVYNGSQDCDFDPCCEVEDAICNVVTQETETEERPTDTPYPPQTSTPQETEEPCQIWVCHKPGTAAEQDYCCWDSQGCLSAHLGHGDYEGVCK